MKKVYIFTLETCQRCKTLKETLKEKNIDFQEIDTITNNDLWVDIVNQTKSNVVPTIFVGEDLGENTEGYIYVPGRDFVSDEELIEKINK
jgi:glutaredoxin